MQRNLRHAIDSVEINTTFNGYRNWMGAPLRRASANVIVTLGDSNTAGFLLG
jgi:hypothetical protein